MYQQLINKEKKIAVVGLGYVGLPIALAFAKKLSVIGFDINPHRVELMKKGIDPSKELGPDEFEGRDISFTANYEDLKDASFYVIAVPTPIDTHKVPNLKPVLSASKMVGQTISVGDYVVFESTVYPGCTEEDCVPIIEKESGLVPVKDFKFGYSPERINPGDKVHRLDNIIKLVSGCDEESLDVISKVYETIVSAGTFKTSSIKVAEASKVIENTQRDLNISFMNELSIIFDKMGVNTSEVIEAASTKWNFLRFHPGLVGGHCIGVDPYYLTYKSKQLGYDPQVILSGRRINDGMPAFVAKKTVQFLIRTGKDPKETNVLVMGITFKEDVSDIRNSKVVDLVHELQDYSISVSVYDPHASNLEVQEEYKLNLIEEVHGTFDAVIVAVNHKEFKNLDEAFFRNILSEDSPIFIDLKGIYPQEIRNKFLHWSL